MSKSMRKTQTRGRVQIEPKSFGVCRREVDSARNNISPLQVVDFLRSFDTTGWHEIGFNVQ